MPMREDLIQNSQALRLLCARDVGDPGTFGEICAITQRISDEAGSAEISASALDVRFKAEDLFNRVHLMSESILRQMLEDRLQRLDALLRVRNTRDRRAPGQRGRRATDRVGAAIA